MPRGRSDSPLHFAACSPDDADGPIDPPAWPSWQDGRWCACMRPCALLKHGLNRMAAPEWLAPLAGEVAYDHAIVQQAASLVRRLPAVKTTGFQGDFFTVGGCAGVAFLELVGNQAFLSSAGLTRRSTAMPC